MGANLSGSQTVEPLPKSVDMSPESLPKQDLKAQQDPKDQLPKAAPEAGNTPANPQPDKDKPMEQPMPTKPPIEVFPEVQPVSAVKFQKSKSNSRSMIGAIQDMQRMPEAAIHEEFSRRIQNFQQRLVPLGDPPCQDVAARMQACLQKSSQRACNCFEVMEEYRHCVVRSTQNRLDENNREAPPSMAVVTPKPMPPPRVMPAKKSGRCWYKFWTWFR